MDSSLVGGVVDSPPRQLTPEHPPSVNCCVTAPRGKLAIPQKTPLDHAALSVFIISMAFIIKTPGHLADKIAYLSQNLINSQHERSLLYTVGNLMHHQEKWVRCANYYS